LIQLRFDTRLSAPHSQPMDEINQNPRTVLIAAVFCAIIGLIAYAGSFHRGWAGSAITSDFRHAVTAGQKAPTGPRQAQPNDRLRAVFAPEDPGNP
jgi:hypothetical protein